MTNEPCPHCGEAKDLVEYRMLIDYVVSPEGPEEKRMVYCNQCGHWGDFDTWDDRPEPAKKVADSSKSTTSLQKGVDILRNALREPVGLERIGE